MAQIDVTQIEGYAEMSAEDKIKALETLSLPDPDFTGYVKKDVFDKTASELAEQKRQSRAKLSEDEAAKQREQEERERLQADYDILLRDSVVSKNKAKLLTLGYDEKLADETADAMASGDSEKVFANQKKHLEMFEKKVLADALKKTPPPAPDGDSKTMTIDKLRSMTSPERYEYSVAHPEEYKELYGGTD